MGLSRKQQGVLRGMISAVLLAAVILVAGAAFFPEHRLPADTFTARFAFAASTLLFVSFWLLVSIGTLARHRFVTPEDIDGSGLTTGTPAAHMYQAILQNTLEQTVLASMAYVAFAALAPKAILGALPAAAVLFWVGRASFWRGYSKGAASRAFGFALTFYSTGLVFLCAAVLLIRTALS